MRKKPCPSRWHRPERKRKTSRYRVGARPAVVAPIQFDGTAERPREVTLEIDSRAGLFSRFQAEIAEEQRAAERARRSPLRTSQSSLIGWRLRRGRGRGRTSYHFASPFFREFREFEAGFRRPAGNALSRGSWAPCRPRISRVALSLERSSRNAAKAASERASGDPTTTAHLRWLVGTRRPPNAEIRVGTPSPCGAVCGNLLRVASLCRHRLSRRREGLRGCPVCSTLELIHGTAEVEISEFQQQVQRVPTSVAREASHQVPSRHLCLDALAARTLDFLPVRPARTGPQLVKDFADGNLVSQPTERRLIYVSTRRGSVRFRVGFLRRVLNLRALRRPRASSQQLLIEEFVVAYRAAECTQELIPDLSHCASEGLFGRSTTLQKACEGRVTLARNFRPLENSVGEPLVHRSSLLHSL